MNQKLFRLPFADKIKNRFRNGIKPASLNVFVCGVIGLTILLTASPSQQIYNSVYTQDDWSGGVGTGIDQFESQDNLDTSVPGELTLQSNNINNWCNNASCDTDWLYREEMHFGISDSMETQSVFIVIDYRPGMKTDFNDLRFTNSNGAELRFFMIEKQDSDSARIWLELTDAAQAGAYTTYLYYGNPLASSTSDSDAVVFEDGFDNDIVTKWSSFQGGNVPGAPVGGVASLDPASQPLGDGIWTNNTFNRDTSKTLQVDLSALGNGCVGQPFNWSLGMISNIFAEILSGPLQTTCGQMQLQAGPFVGAGNSLYTTLDTTGPVTLRVVIRDDGGFDFAYSQDEGRTFQTLPGYDNSPGIDTGDFRIYMSAWGSSDTEGRQNVSNVTLTEGGSQPARLYNYGPRETVGGKIGNLVSAPLDTGSTSPFYQTVDYTLSGSGSAVVRVRTSPNSDMSGAGNWYFCDNLDSGDEITVPSLGSTCSTQGERYVQYSVLMAAESSNDFELNSISINFYDDTVAPDTPTGLVAKTSPSGTVIADGAWTRSVTPYFSWDISADNAVGDSSGVAGYCVYLGTDNTANPQTSTGLISETSQFDSGGDCHYGVTATNLNINGLSMTGGLQDEVDYYLKVWAIDVAGNISGAAQTSFKIDSVDPIIFTQFNTPTVLGSKIFHNSWITGPLVQQFETGSGIAGFKYCVYALIYGDDCDAEGTTNFYGLDHTSGDPHDPTDIIPYEDGGFDTVLADADRMDDIIMGANVIKIIVIDNAGNTSLLHSGVFVITHQAATAPLNLAVTPASNTQNSFSFTWDEPALHFGGRNQLEYCWTVNETIAADGANCNWTGLNVYSLAQGAYATTQGVNTLNLATKDVTGNFDGTQFTNIIFTATTAAPGPPRDLDSSDASIRATSAWKIALSWSAPTLAGSGIDKYKIYRSTDNVSFTEVGETSAGNTGFVDTGLSQTTYYYYVKTCDNANSCSVASSTVSRRPTGRFTTPARLTSDTDQPKVRDEGTQKASIFWFTDRESDSKIAFGKKPGQYSAEEVGNSVQTTSHAVNLTNLEPSTTYYYIAKWVDGDGNIGQSTERSFTTLPAPVIGEVVVDAISTTSAIVNFKVKNASKVGLYYGEGGLGGATSVNTATRESTYSIQLKDLDDGIKYAFKLNGFDVDGNEYQGNTYSFTTLPQPQITNLRFQPVDNVPTSTQKVTWNTNVPATSGLSYGIKDAKQSELLVATLVTEHEMILSDLADDTNYTLTARSADAAGNTAVSDVQIFRTKLDSRAPKISNVTIENSIRGTGTEARGQVVISWKTDEPATSQAAFSKGQSGTLTNTTSEETRLSLEHTVVISDLSTSSIYRVQPVSKDKARNLSRGNTQTTIIGRGSDSLFGLIVNALQKIFGLEE